MYKRRQDWSIYLIYTTVFWWHSSILGSVFRLKKEDTKDNSEDANEGDREENRAGEQLWQELKDEYETKVHNSLQLVSDMILELQLLLFLLYFLHVMFSHHVQLILFLFSDGGKREGRKGSSMKIWNPASDGIREKKVCHISIIPY